MLATTWLIVAVVGLALWTASDMRQYRAFKAVDSSAARQGFYLLWTVQGFVMLVGASVVTAWVLGRDLPLMALPPEFQPLAAVLQPPSVEGRGDDGRLGLAIGIALGLGIAIAVQVWRMRRALRTIVGDVDAMVPRNRREMLAALPLCLNAGFSEELFFRLTLPLLIASVTGSVIVGLVASAVIFGLIHTYQGWKGVIATTIIGVFLTFVYLKSSSLLRPIILHALMDVLALIVRPALAARLGGAEPRPQTPSRHAPHGVTTERDY